MILSNKCGYASCYSLRISEVKRAINEDIIPDKFDSFWSGKIKCGLSGSAVV
jgi:hypothetical protein